MQHLIYPVVLSGGSGTRLWPLSRAALPKQLLRLRGERTMIQDTVLRAQMPGTAAPALICNDGHRFLVAEQMQEIGVKPSAIVLEPVARNTAPAAAVAALITAEQDKEGVVLLLPSDHFVDDEAAFHRAALAAVDAAREGRLVTFGITPTRAETGYGYIKRRGAAVGSAFEVEAFVEKPDAQKAQTYLASGDYCWNSGMFAFRADVFLDELAKLQPAILSVAKAAVAAAQRDLDFVRLDRDAFAKAPNISIDYAVMEKTSRAAVVPCEIGWSDVGSWSALWDVSAQDGDGNVLIGDVVTENASGCFVRTERRLTALVGAKDLAIVVTDDAVLVADKARSQDVKLIVDKLKANGRDESDTHAVVYRPWGSYQTVDAGDRFQVKHIMVKPGGRLSLQKHAKRAEHWVVVQGTAQVTCDDKVFPLKENESTFIPLGSTHRLENLGDEPLRLIEVQSGSYLGEDDIVRLEDVYGRAPEKN
ncbi:MAG TPA: mannose-1-phosphate guanylyltransferase/mannose-6-phosphate isomerase [Rhizomicrobium sp.]|nr:mannose-1-phosphate guanylyltransferase/mannose-6-phosphate isomerase [Rhizomicrobium sp.]